MLRGSMVFVGENEVVRVCVEGVVINMSVVAVVKMLKRMVGVSILVCQFGRDPRNFGYSFKKMLKDVRRVLEEGDYWRKFTMLVYTSMGSVSEPLVLCGRKR